MNPATDFLRNYRTHRGLPALAGISCFESAMIPGLSVEDCVSRVKRYHFAFKRLMQIFQARLTAEPIYELKMAFSLHSHYCAEHCSAMRERVSEMRTPPLGLEKIPDHFLKTFFDEIQNAPTTEELLTGLYLFALPALERCMRRHLEVTHPIADHPTLRLLRFALLEVGEMVHYGSEARPGFISRIQSEAMSDWGVLLQGLLEAAGDLDGSQPAVSLTVQPLHSKTPFVYDKVPKRDARFPDPYNMGVHAEEFLYDPAFRSRDKTLMMYYKRLREI
ncbi:MAG: hypothetical protein RL693_2296, partial [Verrucomicrobiota bacterium]